MSDLIASELPVALRATPGDDQTVQVGVVFNGAFHPLAQFKRGGFEKRNALAAAQAEADAAAAPPAEAPAAPAA